MDYYKKSSSIEIPELNLEIENEVKDLIANNN